MKYLTLRGLHSDSEARDILREMKTSVDNYGLWLALVADFFLFSFPVLRIGMDRTKRGKTR